MLLICSYVILHLQDGHVELRGSDLVEVPNLLPPLPPLKREQVSQWYQVNKADEQYHTKNFKVSLPTSYCQG